MNKYLLLISISCSPLLAMQEQTKIMRGHRIHGNDFCKKAAEWYNYRQTEKEREQRQKEREERIAQQKKDNILVVQAKL
jgi:hypothetical protein